MFTYDEVPAIVVRLMIYIQLSCSYPLVTHFQRSLMFNLFFGTQNVSDMQYRIVTVSISTLPLLAALFYPKVGSILGYSASLSGFFMIYVVPVLTYLKMKKIEIQNPLLAKAIQENEVYMIAPKRDHLPQSIIEKQQAEQPDSLAESWVTSPKLVITDKFMEENT